MATAPAPEPRLSGVTASFGALPHEDGDEFTQMYEGYYAEFEPSSYHETFLVQQMIQARWRVLRMQRLEVRFLSAAMGESSATGDSALIAAIERGAETLATLQRLVTAAERTYHKAHQELLAARRQAARDESAARGAHRASMTEMLNAYLTAPLPFENAGQPLPPPPGYRFPQKLQNEPNSPHLVPNPATARPETDKLKR